MASVYLAVREGDGFTQRVALKLVLRAIADPSVLRRANEERGILAQLEHRNIARLIDGGVTDKGYPFYAMEYVEGIDLLSYADERRLSIRQRLVLFLEVCAPVQFAHERLIIHCDLKPSNILVTDDGHVKLLDFGVARLIDPGAEGDEVTGLWFTPAYASPEQVYRDRPGTPSDVYSLGVLLYELLTGHRPYRFPARSPLAVVQVVGEAKPALPSSIVTQPTVRTEEDSTELGPAALAAARSSTPERMRKRLRGDLDAIVLKALAKDPRNRYSTAEQLAADLRRHLDHEPLASVRPSRGYLLGKFMRRNRVAVVAACFVAVAIGLGVGATLWQAERANVEAARATEEAEKAARVAALMTDLFRLSDPNQVLGDTITARDLLDRGAERIQTEFDDQPLIQAELLSEVAGVYRNLGLFSRAEPLVEQALRLREARLGPDAAEVGESVIQLAGIQDDLGRQNDAIESFRRGIAVRQAAVEGLDPVVVEAQGRLGWLVRRLQRHEEAESLFTVALEGQRVLDPDGGAVADMMFGLAATYHDTGLLDRADSMMSTVLAQVDPTNDPTPMALGALRNVGMIRRVREQYRESEPVLRTAVTMAETLYGSEHPEVFAAKAELGLALWGTGKWDEAESVLRGAILSSTALLGPLHSSTAGLQEALAVVLADRGVFDEAALLFQISLEEILARYGEEDHPGVVTSYARLIEALVGAGRHAEARRYLDLAEAMMDRLDAQPSVYSISTERSRGHIEAAAGNHEQAERHFALAVERAEQLLSRPDHRFVLWAKRDYAIHLAATGRREEAAEILEWVLAEQIEALGEPHPMVDRTRAALAVL